MGSFVYAFLFLTPVALFNLSGAAIEKKQRGKAVALNVAGVIALYLLVEATVALSIAETITRMGR